MPGGQCYQNSIVAKRYQFLVGRKERGGRRGTTKIRSLNAQVKVTHTTGEKKNDSSGKSGDGDST